MIVKNITKFGNSWGVIIPPAILKLLSINPVTDQVILDVQDNEIRIKKIKKDEK